jgi:hypothetical protein
MTNPEPGRGADPAPAPTEAPRRDGDPPEAPRPLIERIGLASVALVLAALFGGVAVAAWVEGEIFLAAMGGLGSLMTIWVGGVTLLRR